MIRFVLVIIGIFAVYAAWESGTLVQLLQDSYNFVVTALQAVVAIAKDVAASIRR